MGVELAIGAVVGIGSAVASHRQQRKANKEAARANRYSRNMARTEHARNVRLNAARARVASANAQAAAAARGGMGGSAVQAQMGSIASQSAEAINFAGSMQSMQEGRFGALQAQNTYMNKAAQWNALGQASSQFAFGQDSPFGVLGQQAQNWWENR